MFGSHLSIAGGMVNALNEAESLGFDAVQVFTANQRQWNARPPSAADRSTWLAKLKAMKWLDGPPRVVSHNSYLANLANPDDAIRQRSIELQRAELERCEALEIAICVIHPGAHLGTPRPKGIRKGGGRPTEDEVAGLKRIIASLDAIHRDLKGLKVITCLETTCGAGTTLGGDFEHLAFIRDGVKEPHRIGFAMDTCHITVAGYDLTTPTGAKAVLEQFDKVCGLDHLRALHVNDSKGGVGSRLDRHEHIGMGTCGESCFRAIVTHPKLQNVPKILETPKEKDRHGTPWDMVNVQRLKAMMGGAEGKPAAGPRVKPPAAKKTQPSKRK
jgi:deoxyribonuclease IV